MLNLVNVLAKLSLNSVQYYTAFLTHVNNISKNFAIPSLLSCHSTIKLMV